jgi:hypothetical protein
MKALKAKVQLWLKDQPTWAFALYASLTAFLTYSCMYSFRKPFVVATFDGYSFLGSDYKICLISAQVVGYTLSKFLGIKYISELKPSKRAKSIIMLIGIAEVALLLFYLVPRPYNFIFMFFNGLPLGIIWGAVFSYLEGRRLTELLGAGLCASFIVASGIVKSVGEWVMIDLHVGEFAMPFVTGLLFAVPLVVAVFFLDCIPSPSAEDEILRSRRRPMDRSQRKALIKELFTGIFLLVTAYAILTIFRELRDNFSAEIWKSLGYGENPAIFTLAELPVAFITLFSLASITLVRSNLKAFTIILLIVLIGFVLIIISTLLFTVKIITGEVWMVAVGTGLYLGYVPFNAFLYERLISSFRFVGNIGFVIYISDAFGYLGSLGVFFYKNFFSPEISWIQFFIHAGFWFSLAGIFFMALAILYFRHKYDQLKTANNDEFRFVAAKPLLTLDAGTSFNK